MLNPSEADRITKKGGGEGGIIHPCGIGGFEIILTLLTKIIAIYVGFFGVSFWGPSLEWALP